jgi:hypothetical protein
VIIDPKSVAPDRQKGHGVKRLSIDDECVLLTIRRKEPKTSNSTTLVCCCAAPYRSDFSVFILPKFKCNRIALDHFAADVIWWIKALFGIM